MNTNHVPADSAALLSLSQRTKENDHLPPPTPRRRGQPPELSARSFLLLAVVGGVRRTFRDRELHQWRTRDDGLRQALEVMRVPPRTTLGRRLVGLTPEAEAHVQLRGESITTQVAPAAAPSPVSVGAGRRYQAQGSQ